MKFIQLKSTSTLILLLILGKGYSQSQGPLNGSIFTNIAIPNSTSPWGNTGNAAVSDDNRAINTIDLANSGDYTDYLQATGFGFTIPTNSLIDGIEVEVERSDLGSKARDYSIRIVKNGVIKNQDKAANQGWPSNDTYRTYGGNTDLWGETWTPADINASNFGFAIAAYRQGGGNGSSFARIDHIRITVYYSALLPVEISNFVNSIQNDKAILQWTTTSELNNNYFILERSKDGIQFYSIGEVKGAGKSNQQLDYLFTDEHPLTGISYYRIKQVDYDGSFSYSSILALNYIANGNNPYISLYPENESNHTLTLQMNNIQSNTSIEIQLIDMQGKIYLDKNIPFSDSNTLIHLSLPYTTPSGIYILHVNTSTCHLVRKLIY